jgi:pSer/pThr/pTyr-binding forkhead associated (FHA) protein
MEVLLVMFRDGGDSRPFPIKKDVTVIGRREDCDLRIAVGDVSRKHCRLIVGSDTVEIEDLGSSNGTFVNGTKIHRSPVSPGDTVQVGPVAFVVQIDGEPSITEAKPITKQTKSAAIDDEIELDELDILNDSGGDSNIDLADLDSSKQ